MAESLALSATSTGDAHNDALHLAEDGVMAASLWNESTSDLRTVFNGRTVPFEEVLSADDFAVTHALLQQPLIALQELG